MRKQNKQLKLRQLFAYVLSIGLMSLQISCKDELAEVQSEEALKAEVTNSFAARTFSGDSLMLQNPYSTENMTKAYQILKDKNPEYGFEEFNVRTTHQYLKFTPSNEEEVSLLKSDSTIHYFDYRLDAEYKKEYLENRIPDNDSIPVYYTAVPVGKSLPNVKHEVLSELYIPEQDKYFSDVKDYKEYEVTGRVENKTDLFNNLLFSAYEQTGNEDELLTENSTPQARWIFGTRWRANGSIRVNDDIAGVRPVTGAQVLMRQWFTVESAITDGNGNFQTGHLRGTARYVIQWERYNYSVRDGSFFQAETHGPNVKNQSWHPILNGGKDEYHALIHQAAHDFYYGYRFGLISPPMNNHFYNFGRQSQIKIAGRLTNSGASSYSHLRSEITFALSAQVHVKSYGNPSDQVYGTTIHELSHALHSVKDRSTYNNLVRDAYWFGGGQVLNRNKRLLESWPLAVETLMTLERYRVRYNITNYTVYQNLNSNLQNYQNRSIAANNHYTSGIYDMTDNFNQRRFGNEFPNDRVEGFTIKELENALPNSAYWNAYRDRIKTMYPNKNTIQFVDELFANWQD